MLELQDDPESDAAMELVRVALKLCGCSGLRAATALATALSTVLTAVGMRAAVGITVNVDEN